MSSGSNEPPEGRTPRFRIDPIPDGYVLSGSVDESVWRLVEALIESSPFEHVALDLREVEALEPRAVEGLVTLAGRPGTPRITLRRPRQEIRQLVLETTEGVGVIIEIED